MAQYHQPRSRQASDRAAGADTDAQRLANILALPGLDKATLKLLQDYHRTWTLDPASFWELDMVDDQHLSRLAQIQSRLTLRRADSEAVSWLHQLGVQGASRRIEVMQRAGSRYKNIEQCLGEGAAFILGAEISETIWTKLMPVKGSKFDAVMQRLCSWNAKHEAAKYVVLRRAVVGWMIDAGRGGNDERAAHPCRMSGGLTARLGAENSGNGAMTSPHGLIGSPKSTVLEEDVDFDRFFDMKRAASNE